MHPRAVITNTGFHRLQWIKRESQASNGFSEARTPRRSVMDNMRFADQDRQTQSELEQALDSVQLLEKGSILQRSFQAVNSNGSHLRALLTKPDFCLMSRPRALTQHLS